MKKFVAIVLVVIMTFSLCTTALAMNDFVAGEIVIRLKDEVEAENGYEALFPELELEKVVEIDYFGCGSTYNELVLVLKEKTDEVTLAAVELLEENTNILWTRPNSHQYYVGDIRVGDADRDGFRANDDLVVMAMYMVGKTTLSDAERAGADVNGDGEISNLDLVTLAKILVRDVEVPLSEELKAQMVSDFRKQLNDENHPISIRRYFGTFGGCEVATITPAEAETAAMVFVDAAGYWFRFPGGATALYVYKGSQFLKIHEAYEAGWLTEEDVAAIWDLLGGGC